MKVVMLAIVVGLFSINSCAIAKGGGYGYSSYRGYSHSYGNSLGSTVPRAPMPSYGTGSNLNSTSVRGYTRSNGTYVAPARRSMPDNSINNNWTTKGNYNPYTGSAGTKRGNPFGN